MEIAIKLKAVIYFYNMTLPIFLLVIQYFYLFFQSAVELVILLVLVIACGYVFGQINRWAGVLFVPYIVWSTYATYLNIALYILNDLSNSTQTKSD